MPCSLHAACILLVKLWDASLVMVSIPKIIKHQFDSAISNLYDESNQIHQKKTTPLETAIRMKYRVLVHQQLFCDPYVSVFPFR